MLSACLPYCRENCQLTPRFWKPQIWCTQSALTSTGSRPSLLRTKVVISNFFLTLTTNIRKNKLTLYASCSRIFHATGKFYSHLPQLLCLLACIMCCVDVCVCVCYVCIISFFLPCVVVYLRPKFFSLPNYTRVSNSQDNNGLCM